MEKISNQKSHNYIDRIGKVNPIRIQQDKGRHWRHPITMSNSVARFVRRWVADYCATMDAMNDLFSSLAKESAKRSIKLKTLRSSSTVTGRPRSLVRHAGLMMCGFALTRLRHHYGLARSAKS